MASPKLTVNDFTLAPQATTEPEVNAQDARTRLWQSLNYSYGNQLRKSDESYDKAISQSFTNALMRGMQRSSYALQTGANLLNKKSEAQRDIGDALIAAYQSGVNQIEQQEKEDDRWERQFAADREDSAWNKEFQTGQFEYQKGRDTIADEQWLKQFEEGVRQWNLNYDLQKANSDGSRSGGGGGGGTGGDGLTGLNVPPYSAKDLDTELAIRDTAHALKDSAQNVVTTAGNKLQADQYQRQINALTKKLSTAQSDAERTSYRNQITALQQKMNALR